MWPPTTHSLTYRIPSLHCQQSDYGTTATIRHVQYQLPTKVMTTDRWSCHQERVNGVRSRDPERRSCYGYLQCLIQLFSSIPPATGVSAFDDRVNNFAILLLFTLFSFHRRLHQRANIRLELRITVSNGQIVVIRWGVCNICIGKLNTWRCLLMTRHRKHHITQVK